MLRRARPEDADALAEILRSAMQGAMPWLPELHTPDEDRTFLREHVLAEQEVWVAESDDAVIGFTALGTRDGLEFMEHLYVAPGHKRSGVGSALLQRRRSAAASRPRVRTQPSVGALRHRFLT